MYKKTLIVLILFMFTLMLVQGGTGEGEKLISPSKKIGRILLDHIISGFKAIAIKGDGAYKTVDVLLQNSMALLRQAKEETKIDSVFYRRYKRILEVLKLSIMNSRNDRERILSDHIAREIQSFIYDITGETKNLETSGSKGIGSISQAVSFELLNLHIYLDTKDNRPALVKKYFRVPPPPPPAKKKKRK